MHARTTSWSIWTPWAFAILAMPLVLLAVELLRGASHEINMVRSQVLRNTMHEAHSQAMGRAKALEVLLDADDAVEKTWADKLEEPWLTRFWSEINLIGDHEVYAAVVDESGNIVLHSDATRMGQRLARGWYDRRVPEAGPDVVWAPRSTLGGDRATYDVHLPLSVRDRPVGEYHQGIDAPWIESKIAGEQRAVVNRWLVVFALVGAVDAAAVAALIFLVRRQGRVWRNIRAMGREQAREIAQIGAGLAHEVRNPLHALRINLHTLRRSFGGRTLPEDQLVATIEESDAAIDRLDELMRDLLQFTDPTKGELNQVDLVHEVRATLSLMSEDLRRDQIALRSQLTETPSPIVIDPARLRQLLLNLLTFAQNRAGKNGAVDVSVAHANGEVEVAIGDSGPALPQQQRAHLFEPFQAPAETGSGLGLALVQVYVEEAGGRASIEGEGSAESCHLWFPLATPATNGERL